MKNGKYKIIKIKELKDGKVRFFNDSASVDVDDKQIIEKYIVKNGDVLFALTGDPVNKKNPLSWVGRVSVYEDNQLALLNQRVCKLIPKEELNAKYIYYYFRAFNNFYALVRLESQFAHFGNRHRYIGGFRYEFHLFHEVTASDKDRKSTRLNSSH